MVRGFDRDPLKLCCLLAYAGIGRPAAANFALRTDADDASINQILLSHINRLEQIVPQNSWRNFLLFCSMNCEAIVCFSESVFGFFSANSAHNLLLSKANKALMLLQAIWPPLYTSFLTFCF